jgi:prolyl-tRNA synthetase
VEVGPRDLAEGSVTLVRRDTSEKVVVPIGEVANRVPGLLDDIQAAMFDEALARRDEGTVAVTSIDDAVEVAQRGFAVLPYATVGESGEDALNARGATVRCLQMADGGLPLDASAPDVVAYVARAY